MTKLPEIFGNLVFNEEAMRERLPEESYLALKRTIDQGEALNPALADVVARAMKEWALEKGVTHYTHWFHPLSGVTAEKHESFIAPDGKGGVKMELSGKALIKGEADASSFPSGGLRATFEARGYTAWDPTSFAFIKDGVLCIPTAYCSYGGEALDLKTPLLRSMDALSAQALRVLALFGTSARRVTATVGAEQEYFLVDRDRYYQRKDLIYTGRTLFGAKPPKGQELDDHYYGMIKLRVSAFMKELNEELWKLGILAKTEHNEAAPAQHELAPIFASCNVACDHNQVTMEIMRRVAKRHNLTCLLHEKPFEGVSGSGKHDNWSLSTNTGVNLLEPGDTPAENAQFLLFLLAVVKAVDDYQDLLRISVAGAGNDHRLGGSEAPPAILSVSLGEDLEKLLGAIEKGEHAEQTEHRTIRVGSDVLPPIPQDTTDRNRTAPFAFTGNKFEFRMPGSQQSLAWPNTVLNSIVAASLGEFADVLEQAEDFNASLNALLRETITKHKRILFSGDGYDESWRIAAEKCGLTNYSTSDVAIPHLLDEKNVRMFEKLGVLSETELRARCEIMLENYCKQINIEAMTMIEMARRDILPAVIGYSGRMANAMNAKKAACPGLACAAETALLEKVGALTDEMHVCCLALEEAVSGVQALPQNYALRATYYRETVLEAMAALREAADELETVTDKGAWPYPSYGRLLYRV